MLRACAGNGGGFRYMTLRLLFIVSAAAFLLTVLQLGFSQRRMASKRIKGSKYKQYRELVNTEPNRTSIPTNDQLNRSASEYPDADGSIDLQQKRRQQLLAELCPQLTPSTVRPFKSSDYSEFLVDDRRQYIYCKVEKVACTSWKRTLLDLTGQFQNARKLNFYRVHSRFVRENVLRPLSSYKRPEIEFRLKTYFKFMFTRHPFERLVSAFRSKIKRDKEYKGLRSRIKRRQKKKKSAQTSEFAQFVQFVLDKAARGKQLDVHWRPQYDICRPCSVTFDFIGHYETLYADAEFVLNRLQTVINVEELDNSTSSSFSNSTINGASRKLVKFPRSDPDNKRTNSMYLVRKMMSELSPASLERLKKLYDRDFRLHGYKSK